MSVTDEQKSKAAELAASLIVQANDDQNLAFLKQAMKRLKAASLDIHDVFKGSITSSAHGLTDEEVENLKALGVNVAYNRIDPSQLQDRRQNNDFEMRFAGYRSALIEGSGLEQKYGCDDREDIFNAANYCNPVVDQLAKMVAEAKTYDQLSTIVKAIDRIMRYDYFIVPTWALQENWVAYYDMFEYPENLPEFGLGHLDYWWINPEKEADLMASGALK